MKLSLIIVHYHTPGLLGNLLACLGALNDLHSIQHEIIIINNGGDISLTPIQDSQATTKVFQSDTNLGYAGGINKGVELSCGEYLVLMNADVHLHLNSVRELIHALDEFDVVGPRFFLDLKCAWMLPPHERMDVRYILTKKIQTWHPYLARRLHRMWWYQFYRHWSTEETIESLLLSGAMLAMKRRTWDIVGTFDDQYALYFEETDWLCRLRKKGLKSAYVPNARVTHFYNQSAQNETAVPRWNVQSEERFMKQHYGHFFGSLLLQVDKLNLRCSRSLVQKAWARRNKKDGADFIPIRQSEKVIKPDEKLFLEMSNSLSFVPSAVYELDHNELATGIALSSEVWQNLAKGDYYFRVVDTRGHHIYPSTDTRSNMSSL